MKFFCDQCHAQYMIADEKIGPRGVKVKCKKCTNVIHVRQPDSEAAGAAPVDERPATPAEAPAAVTSAAAGPAADAGSAPVTSEPVREASSHGTGAVWTGNAPQAEAPRSAPAAGANDKIWFVAIGEAQVGPLDVAEVHQRWDAGELHEDSLAWRAGMPDWITLADIPTFTEWVAQRPRKAPDKAEQAAKRGEGLGLAPASGAAWKPSAASALSNLMQEELLAASAPKVVAKQAKPEGVPDIGPAVGGVGDLFAATPAEGHTATPNPSGAGGGGGAAWSVPPPRPGLSGARLLFALGGAVLAVGGIGLFALRSRAPQAPVVAQVMPQGAPQPAAAPPPQVMSATPQPTASKGPSAEVAPTAGGSAGTAVAQAPAAAPAAPPDSHAAAAGPASAAPTPAAAGRAADAAPAGVRDGSVADASRKGPRAKRSRDRVAGAELGALAPAAAGPVKASLSKEDIWGVVRQSASRVAPCIKAARARNEFPAGKYTFILDWTIRPDGAVLDARLKGPAEVLATSLPGCFSAAMLQWRFPASQAGAPIANFPFGPVNVP
jgi:predicted Zn finger-like uncharacterized protein